MLQHFQQEMNDAIVFQNERRLTLQNPKKEKERKAMTAHFNQIYQQFEIR